MDQEIFTRSKIEKRVMFYSVKYNKNTQAHTTKLQANESQYAHTYSQRLVNCNRNC